MVDSPRSGSNLADIIIPVAPYHQDRVGDAVASAYAQTVPCGVIVVDDVDSRGAGYARNLGVARSNALFVVFLDADDTLASSFVEETLAVYAAGTYVYCDDRQGESLHQTPDMDVYRNGTWHVVTTLLPRRLFNAVGGFDESLPALEDLDLYLKLQAVGVCPLRCKKPLVWYTQGGQRSRLQRERDPENALRNRIAAKYMERIEMTCAKCGGNGTVPAETPGTHANEEGFVLAEALYSKRQEWGPASGILYDAPRGYNGYRLWVHESDVQAAPEKWRRVVEDFDPKQHSPSIEEIRRMVIGQVQS